MSSASNSRHANQSKRNIRFLIVSFGGLALFSVMVFSILGIYMNRRSQDTISEVGELYMEGVREQISLHFETAINLQLEQLKGLVEMYDAEDLSPESLRAELAYRAEVRNFSHLAFYDQAGAMEFIYGGTLEVIDSKPFLESMKAGDEKAAVGRDAQGNEGVWLGVQGS